MKKEKTVEPTSKSGNDAKPIVKRSVWVVYPDSVKMGLAAENTAAAWFLYSDHAYKYAKSMWEGFYIVERVVIHCGYVRPGSRKPYVIRRYG